MGGAHKNPAEMAANLKEALIRNLKPLLDIPSDRLLEERYQKFRIMGRFIEA
jgi:acetyl-CoA carboxylase carboxyl transferase subunit alpha